MKELKERIYTYAKLNSIKIIYICSVVAILLINSFSVVLLLNVVKVQDDSSSSLVVTTFKQPNQVIELANMSLTAEDDVLYTSMQGGYANLTIKHPFNVNITVDGQTISTKIAEGTVADCLNEAGIILGEHDYTSPSLNTIVRANEEIRVYRVEYKDTVYQESIPFETEYRSNSLLYRFKKSSHILKEGKNGLQDVTYRERYVDGELVLSLVSKVEVVQQPQNQLVLNYAKKAISPLEAPEGISIVNNVPSSYKQVITNVAATGYSASRGRGSSGLGLYCGTVAVNPNVIPYGSKLYITSPDGEFIYGFAIATDTGSALMEGHIGVDLFYETYKESSLNWKNTVNVYIL